MLNIFNVRQLVQKLTRKSASVDDSIIVVTQRGTTEKVSASDFMGQSDPIFSQVSFDASPGNDYDGTTIASKNVESVIRESEGLFRIVFANEHPTGKYTVVSSAGEGNHISSGRTVSIDSHSKTSVVLRIERTDHGTQQDEAYIGMIVMN